MSSPTIKVALTKLDAVIARAEVGEARLATARNALKTVLFSPHYRSVAANALAAIDAATGEAKGGSEG